MTDNQKETAYCPYCDEETEHVVMHTPEGEEVAWCQRCCRVRLRDPSKPGRDDAPPIAERPCHPGDGATNWRAG